jgi:hypothetical protein
MRDGIYKNLPLGQVWKSLLRSCEREKERGETANRKARRAIISDLNAELSPPFVQQLLANARQREHLLPGFDGMPDKLTPRDLGGKNSPLENDVLRHFKRLCKEGERGRANVDKALAAAIDDNKRRRTRHLEQACLSEAGIKAKPLISAAKQAIAEVNTGEIVDAIARGEKPRAQRGRRSIDIDEDLTKVN